MCLEIIALNSEEGDASITDRLHVVGQLRTRMRSHDVSDLVDRVDAKWKKPNHPLQVLGTRSQSVAFIEKGANSPVNCELSGVKSTAIEKALQILTCRRPVAFAACGDVAALHSLQTEGEASRSVEIVVIEKCDVLALGGADAIVPGGSRASVGSCQDTDSRVVGNDRYVSPVVHYDDFEIFDRLVQD